MSYALIQASASAIPLADETVQCVVTSPPYWGLRSYAGEQTVEWSDGTTHPLGLEPTPELYVAHMVEVFREVKRVLRPDGTLWMNLGDSYASATGIKEQRPQRDSSGGIGNAGNTRGTQSWTAGTTLAAFKDYGEAKPKDLVGIPWMVAFALRADGWYLRSDIIWHKPNPMPESVTDRPTKAHEYLFLLSKSERYFYDADAIKEPGADPLRERSDRIGGANGHTVRHSPGGMMGGSATRNRRDVWTIATRPYAGAHFATYPEDLVEPCILAGSSPTACGICGAPWGRVTEKGEPILQAWSANGAGQYDDSIGAMRRTSVEEGSTLKHIVPRTTVGWQPTCEHNDDSGQCIVLDPFNGSGTTGRVAMRHGRSYVGLDVSREYLDGLALARIDPLADAARKASSGTRDAQGTLFS